MTLPKICRYCNHYEEFDGFVSCRIGYCDIEDCKGDGFELEDDIASELTLAEFAELATAKADGHLLILPCKAGDTLYRVDTYNPQTEREIEIRKIDNIVICDNGDMLFKADSYDDVICDLACLVYGTLYMDYYRVF